ncbi:GrpB family protein [Metabacillus bambusae]|uniref:GrpB family protein n=1 Tax=Metabacillus bambusae TaxID=2795218 RepID=A0ABS3N8G0_9BACI|nr:GrpB family protein [Metabacillus bambusae]MBO1514574.1 GrpB family protein [Metabacillus bambusae]
MKITLSSYNPKWPVDFEEEKKELTGIIGDLEPLIEHIGSTSIRGLSAKPIIDIMIGIKEESLLDTVASRMAEASFVYLPIYNEQRYHFADFLLD